MKQKNKAFKSGKHISKGQAKKMAKGRVEKRQSLKSASNALPSKEERKNRAKQIQQNKKKEVLFQKRIGRHGPPKIVGLIPLGDGANVSAIISLISEAEGHDATATTSLAPKTIVLKGHKQRVTLIPAAATIQSVMDIGKIADLLLLVIPANSGVSDEGEVFISVLKSQGIPAVIGVVQGLTEAATNAKLQQELKKRYSKFLQSEFSDEPKLVPCDKLEDTKQLCRWITEQRPRTVHWRERRAYLVADQHRFIPNSTDTSDSSSATGTLVVSGFLRGRDKSLSANHLVHLLNYGSYQIKQICSRADPYPLNARENNNAMTDVQEAETVLQQADPSKQETLVAENTPDPLANEQTWPTEEELAEAEAEGAQIGEKKTRKIRVPKGFSAYQAAWIVDNEEEEEGDDDDDDEEDDEGEDAEMAGEGGDAQDEEGSDGSESEYEEIEIDDGKSEVQTQVEDAFDILRDEQLTAEEREQERQRVLQAIREANDDMENPDEVDTPVDMAARMRFQRYRGLKSFRRSEWDPKESLPLDYARIFQFENLQLSQKRAMQDTSGVDADIYVSIYIDNVPATFVERYNADVDGPLILFGLLRHEFKTSVLHMTIQRHPTYTLPIRSKERFLVQIGFRSFRASPLFSENSPNSDKQKFERFLQPSRFSAATIFGPITYSPAPVCFFKELPNGKLQLAATGSLVSANPDRILLKKIVLTGHPFRVHKKQSVVRFMFHNPDDVRWFKPVEVHTRAGHHGVIKEPVGTHGYMKVRFNNHIRQDDIVRMNLYKRVFPKWNTEAYSKLYEPTANSAADIEVDDATSTNQKAVTFSTSS